MQMFIPSFFPGPFFLRSPTSVRRNALPRWRTRPGAHEYCHCCCGCGSPPLTSHSQTRTRPVTLLCTPHPVLCQRQYDSPVIQMWKVMQTGHKSHGVGTLALVKLGRICTLSLNHTGHQLCSKMCRDTVSQKNLRV